MTNEDALDVLAIYVEGIATGHATFQSHAPEWSEWSAEHLSVGRMVAELGDEVVGRSALSGVSSRCVYRGVAELGVYVRGTARGMGVGRKLLEALILESERNGIWTLEAAVFPENLASIRLHEAVGFRIVGNRVRLGQMEYGPMTGEWRDVVLLERRSDIVGA